MPKRSQAIEIISVWAQNQIRLIAPLMTLIVLVIFFSLVTERFSSWLNFINILHSSSILLIAGCGITMVLLIAEIDLSFASLMTFLSIVMAALYVTAGLPGWLVIPVVFAVGLAMGALNGVSIAYAGIPSFAVTLATMTIFTGFNEYITEGKPYYKVPDILYYLGNERLMGLPWLVYLAVAIAVFFAFVLKYTRFGRQIYMVGGNAEAARLSGVNVKRIRLLVYVIMGATAAIAALLGTGRLGSTQTGEFESLLIAGIASVVIGGTSLFGGVGGIGHTIVGVLIWYVLRNGLDMMDISIYLKTLVIGIILLLALFFNTLLQKQQSR
jgi:ribose/xylose/arabinose/galactoside ABC-type transport system permease subunit